MTSSTDKPDAAAALAQRAKSNDRGAEVERRTSHVRDLLTKLTPEISRALPSHMNADRMARLALTVFRKTPKLLECSPESFLGAVMTCSQLGMEPGPTGEAFIVPYKGEATFQLGYKGMVKLFWQHPLAAYLDTQTVYENDDFDYQLGLNPDLVHRPRRRGDRGEPLGEWYAVAKFTNGGFRFTVLDRNQVEARRSRSQSPNSPAWRNDYNAMAEKSCIRDMFDLMPKSAEIIRALAQDGSVRIDTSPDAIDEPEWMGEVIDAEPMEQRPGEPSAEDFADMNAEANEEAGR